MILEALEEAVGRDLDPFDLICHVAFDQPPLTRRERAEGVKKRNVFSMYEDKAREVLGILLDKYADQGIETIEKIDVLRLDPFTQIGTPIEIVKSFGGRDKYLEAVQKLETARTHAAKRHFYICPKVHLKREWRDVLISELLLFSDHFPSLTVRDP